MRDRDFLKDRIRAQVASERAALESMGLSGKSGAYLLFGEDGQLKQSGRVDNLVVDDGDDYLVDQLADTPAIGAMDCMVLGTGGSVAPTKGDTWVNTGFAGNGHDTVGEGGIDSGFPKIKPGSGNENILQFQATYNAGYATQNGIDEAIISNTDPDGAGGDPGGSTILARGVLSPSVNKGASDSLVIVWEITFLGA